MKTICITGSDGCGKSTQAELLSGILPDSRIVSVWDLIKRPEFQSWSIYKTAPNVEQYVVNLQPLSRSMFVFHAFNEAYHHALSSGASYLIFDGYWYKYWAVEQAMGSAEAFGKFLSSQYVTPDKVFYLDLQVEEVLKRKQDISVYEAGNQFDKVKAFVNFQLKTQDILRDLLPDKSITIDATGSVEDIHQHILSNLQDWNV